LKAGGYLQDPGIGMRLNHSVYMDYQATTPVDPAVIAAMDAAWRNDFANPHSVEHALGWGAAAALEKSAAAVGAFVGASGDHVVFTSGATEANWLAILGIAARAPRNRTRLLLSAAEHKSVLAAGAEAQRRFGMEVTVLGVDTFGCVDPTTLRSCIDDRVALVSIMAVNHEVGALNDIAGLARISRKHGALFHVDASQAPAACDSRALAHHTDLLTLSAHKAYGPKGIGALIAAPDVQDRLEPLMRGGGQQAGLRPGTAPTPLCVGFAAALQEFDRVGAGAERVRVARLRDRFLGGLKELSGGIELVGPPRERRHPGNACVRIHGVDGADLIASLQPRLAASTQSACNSGSTEPSPVLLAIGLEPDAARECVRFSVGRFTTEDQVDDAVRWIVTAIAGRRELVTDSNGAVDFG